MKSLLQSLYLYFEKRRPFFFFLTAVLAAALVLIATRVHIEEDVTKLLPNGKEIARTNELLRNAHFADRIIVRIQWNDSAINQEMLIAAADFVDSALTQAKGEKGGLVKSVKSQIDDQSVLDIYDVIHQNLPLFLEEKDYSSIDSITGNEAIAANLERNYKILASASGVALKRFIADDPSGISNLALKKMNGLQVDENYTIYDNHIITKDQRAVLLFVMPEYPANETGKNALLISELNQLTSRVHQFNPNLEMLYYGGTAVAAGNAGRLKTDTIVTLSITLLALLAFIWFAFRRKRVPFIMLLPLVFGSLFALAIIAVTKGSISSIALASGSIVMGIAINYSVHFYIHFRHCRSNTETIGDLLMPLTVGSITTVGSFFSLMLVKSQVLNDFGLFAGLSLLGAAFTTLIILPHFLPDTSTESEHPTPLWIEKLATAEFPKSGYVVAVIAVITIFFLFQIKKVRVDADLNNLNYMTAEMKRAELAINSFDSDSAKTVFIASTGTSREEALQHAEELNRMLEEALHKQQIQRLSSVVSFIPSEKEQQAKIERWRRYWTEAKKQKLLLQLHEEGAKLGFRTSAFQSFEQLLNRNYTVANFETFTPFRSAFADEYLIDGKNYKAIMTAVQIERKKRPQLYEQISRLEGNVILDKQVITSSLLTDVYNDFNSILLYTSGLVFIALVLSYGRFELALITFLPMVISWIWILGIMGLTGMHFNLINIILSTFIFGLGDDFAIFITDGLREKYKSGKDNIAAHKVSIFIAAVTTILGLGALIFAKHPALHSIAVISIIGIVCVLFIGRTVQPFLFNYYLQHRADQGLPPYTLLRFVVTFITYSWFVIGSLVVGIVGFVLFRTMNLPGIKRRKRHYHRLIQICVKITVYLPYYVKKKYINRELMDFSKPAIIIANHSSILDILTTVMQHPKLILLTNKWVYHSPVFGRVVQLADYYPVMEGAEPATDKLRDIMNDGYSIVIFPEGTRSADGKIGRFHKGAFYLAEKLQADIVPLLLHGHHDVIPKGDFHVFPGTMTMKYLPRIKPNDMQYGIGYAARTKAISAYFKSEFEKLKQELETPAYFEGRLVNNYIYKGPVLEWYTRQKIKIEKLYTTYDRILPKKGTIVDLGCGFGYMAYMLHYLSSERRLIGVDYDEEKIGMANHNFSKTEALNFVHGSIVNFKYEMADAFVINDVLHYLTYEEQELVITRCVEHLNTNGVLVIKDGDCEDTKGTQMTRLSEFFSTNFGFNQMAHGQMFFTSESRLRATAEKLNLSIELVEKSTVSSNTIFLLRRKEQPV